eukprot:496339_1
MPTGSPTTAVPTTVSPTTTTPTTAAPTTTAPTIATPTTSMVVQSCVKNINVTNLTTSDTNNPYPTGPNTFKISIAVDSESPKETSPTTLSGGSASFPTEICFDFDSSNPSFTPIISYNPIRGRSITFNIMGNGNTFGSVT